MLKKYNPSYIANYSIVASNGEIYGFLTPFKIELVELINSEKVSVEQIARLLAIKPMIVENWVRLHSKGKLQTSIRERIYTTGMNKNITAITLSEFTEIVKTVCVDFRCKCNHTVQQFNYYYNSIIGDQELYSQFVYGDGDISNLPSLVELIIENTISDNEEYKALPSTDSIQHQTTVEEDIATVQLRLSNLRYINKKLSRSNWIDDSTYTTVYKFRGKPKSALDLLATIYNRPDCTPAMLARFMDLDDSYVYPHVRAGILPKYLQHKVAENIIRFVDGSYVFVSSKLISFMTYCHTWDWEVLFLEDGLFDIVDITLDLPEIDRNDAFDTIFDIPLDKSQYWSFYTPVWDIEEYKEYLPTPPPEVRIVYKPGVGIQIHPFHTQVSDMVIAELAKIDVDSEIDTSLIFTSNVKYKTTEAIPRVRHKVTKVHADEHEISVADIWDILTDLNIRRTDLSITINEGMINFSGYGDKRGILVQTEDKYLKDRVTKSIPADNVFGILVSVYRIAMRTKEDHTSVFLDILDEASLKNIEEEYVFE